MILEDSILYMYPDLLPNADFVIVADRETLEQSISYWNDAKYPQPTRDELNSAWVQASGKIQTDSRLSELRQYLSDTDYYWIRHLEIGDEIPPDILQKRISARQELRVLGA